MAADFLAVGITLLGMNMQSYSSCKINETDQIFIILFLFFSIIVLIMPFIYFIYYEGLK